MQNLGNPVTVAAVIGVVEAGRSCWWKRHRRGLGSTTRLHLRWRSPEQVSPRSAERPPAPRPSCWSACASRATTRRGRADLPRLATPAPWRARPASIRCRHRAYRLDHWPIAAAGKSARLGLTCIEDYLSGKLHVRCVGRCPVFAPRSALTRTVGPGSYTTLQSSPQILIANADPRTSASQDRMPRAT